MFFLWEYPSNPERALIFAGNAGSTCGIRGGSPSCPFSVWDIYVLEYDGRFENEVRHIGFLEGNSNQGDAL